MAVGPQDQRLTSLVRARARRLDSLPHGLGVRGDDRERTDKRCDEKGDRGEGEQHGCVRGRVALVVERWKERRRADGRAAGGRGERLCSIVARGALW